MATNPPKAANGKIIAIGAGVFAVAAVGVFLLTKPSSPQAIEYAIGGPPNWNSGGSDLASTQSGGPLNNGGSDGTSNPTGSTTPPLPTSAGGGGLPTDRGFIPPKQGPGLYRGSGLPSDRNFHI